MKRRPKPLDEFDLVSIMRGLGSELLLLDGSPYVTAAAVRRWRSRILRFISSHPSVTPKMLSAFRKASRPKRQPKAPVGPPRPTPVYWSLSAIKAASEIRVNGVPLADLNDIKTPPDVH